MSDLTIGEAASPTGVLVRRQAALAQAHELDAASADRWAGALAWLLLALTILYVLIGNTPYQHLTVFDPKAGGPTISPVNRFIWLALLGLSAPILWLRRAGLTAFALGQWPLILLMIWFAATTRWSIDPTAANRRLFLYLIDVIVALAAAIGLKDGRQAHLALASACGIVIAIDLIGWIVAPRASMTELGLAGIHNHKNTLGAAMLFSGLVCGSFIFAQPTWPRRLLWIGVTAGGLVLLIASRSKTSLAILISASLLAPVLIWLLRRRAPTALGLALSALAAMFAALMAWLAWNAIHGDDPFAAVSRITFTQRTDVWRFAFSQFLKRPWTGLGFGSFWDVDPAVQPSLQTDYWFARPDSPTNEAHNGYIDLLVTTGVPGLAGAVFLLGRWIVRSVALLRGALRAPATAAGERSYLVYLAVFPLVFVVHNCMESSYFTANAMFGVVILLAGADIDAHSARRKAHVEASQTS